MNNLAAVYSSQGQYREAEELFKKALEGRRKQLGNDHTDTLWSMNGLAIVYSSQGRYDEAEELQKRALEGMKKRIGGNHPRTFLLMNNLADVYKSQGRHDEAEQLRKQVLEGKEKHVMTRPGRSHPCWDDQGVGRQGRWGRCNQILVCFVTFFLLSFYPDVLGFLTEDR
jgi:tetratricopeptide (TPR) repeat protein